MCVCYTPFKEAIQFGNNLLSFLVHKPSADILDWDIDIKVGTMVGTVH